MKKLVIILILLAAAVTVRAKAVDFFIFFKSTPAGVPGVMDGVIANPAGVKIANPAAQNIGLN